MAACARPDEVADVQDVLGSRAPGGTPFTRALFQEYQAYTQSEVQSEVEWVDAAATARKAQRVAAGEVVLPEDLAGWPVPAARRPNGTCRSTFLAHEPILEQARAKGEQTAEAQRRYVV